MRARTGADAKDLTLEERVRRIEDQLAINQLVMLYMLVMDEHDEAGIRRVFADDAKVISEHGSFFGASGLDEILATWTDRFPFLGPEYHVVNMHLVRFDDADPDTAYGLVSAHAEVVRKGVAMVTAIRYRDRYRRIGEVWKIAHRVTSLGYYLPVAEYEGGVGAPDRVRVEDEPQPADWPWFRTGSDAIKDLHAFY